MSRTSSGEGRKTVPLAKAHDRYQILHCSSSLWALCNSRFLCLQPCRQFCDRVRGVCGEEIRGLSSFTSLLREVTVNFTCEGLPLPDAGSAPECYEQRGVASPTLDQPSKWPYLGIKCEWTICKIRAHQQLFATGFYIQMSISRVWTPQHHSI